MTAQKLSELSRSETKEAHCAWAACKRSTENIKCKITKMGKNERQLWAVRSLSKVSNHGPVSPPLPSITGFFSKAGMSRYG